MQSRDRAAAFLFAEIAQMQRAYPETGFATPPINPTDRNDQVLVNRILDALGAHDQDHLLGFVVHVAAKFKGFAWGGTKRTPRAPGSPTGPHSVVLLVNWAQDYARVANMSKCRAKPGRQAVEDNEDLRGQAEDGSDEAKKSRGVASWEEMGKTECQERMKRALKSLEGERGWKLLTPDQRYARAETAARHQLCEELRAERGASAQADTNG
jgi:hypothetical protein